MKTDQFGVQFSEDGKTLIKCPKDLKGKYDVPDGITAIADRAFDNCRNLVEVTMVRALKRLDLMRFTIVIFWKRYICLMV